MKLQRLIYLFLGIFILAGLLITLSACNNSSIIEPSYHYQQIKSLIDGRVLTRTIDKSYHAGDTIEIRNEFNGIETFVVEPSIYPLDTPEEWQALSNDSIFQDTLIAWRDSVTGVVHIGYSN